MKFSISDIIVPFIILLGAISTALTDVVSYSSRLAIIIGIAMLFTLITSFVYFKNRAKNRKKQI